MRLSDLVAKKTVQRLRQAIFKAGCFDHGDKARPFGLVCSLWQVVSRESHVMIFYVPGKYNCFYFVNKRTGSSSQGKCERHITMAL